MGKNKISEGNFERIVGDVCKKMLSEELHKINDTIDGKYIVYDCGTDEMVDVVIDTKHNLIKVSDMKLSGKDGLQAINFIKKQKAHSSCSTEEAIESWLYELGR
ncbi:MAG: hypothetical protein J6X18_06915 [Bacteroidales bacterium]|nr:hypothetical protein [Bacteroidales bacterium]